MRITILGANGQLGRHLQRALNGQHQVSALDRAHLDLTDSTSIETVLSEHPCEVLINAAAYTAVDKAEEEEEAELAEQINGQAVGQIGGWCEANQVMLIHFSTDYVFGAGKPASGAWTEEDTPRPKSVYGQTKLLGDMQLLNNPYAYILRIGWVYSAQGANFLLTMCRLMQSLEELNVVNDQFGTPTYTGTVVDAVQKLLVRQFSAGEDKAGLVDPANSNRVAPGMYHLGGSEVVSWYEFACAIRDHLQQHTQLRVQKINSIPSKDYPQVAVRPGYSMLSHQKFCTATGFQLPTWQDELSRCVSELTF